MEIALSTYVSAQESVRRVRSGEPRDGLHTCVMDSLLGGRPEQVCRGSATAQEAESVFLSLCSHQCKSSLGEPVLLHAFSTIKPAAPCLHKPHVPQGDPALVQWLIVTAYRNQDVSPALYEN